MIEPSREVHPRPTLVRQSYWPAEESVPFEWTERGDANAADLRSGHRELSGTIHLPFPPESAASGVGRTSSSGTLWYSINVPLQALEAHHESGGRLLVHFEGLYGDASVWLNGHRVEQAGARYSRSTIDLTDFLGGQPQKLIVEVEIDHSDLSQPRGKQDWQEEPHAIWYGRSSGIWRDVWFESVPRVYITDATAQADLDKAHIAVEVAFNVSVEIGTELTVAVGFQGAQLARSTVLATGSTVRIVLPLDLLNNEHDRQSLLWSAQTPNLVDLELELNTPGAVDIVGSYAGLREVGIGGMSFTINHRPEYLTAVLEQYYWPDSHFTAPSDAHRRAEVELILELGFNAVRIHQVSPDPRFLYWCDVLGVMVWAEAPAAYQFNTTAVANTLREWVAIMRQAMPHPCVVTWVPFNESWGIPAVERSAQQQDFVQSVVSLTRTLDPHRPVISNDGWEHVDSDVLAFHDYSQKGTTLASRFTEPGWVAAESGEYGIAGRRAVVSRRQRGEVPVMLSEFGGVTFDTTGTRDTWGYGTVTSVDAFEATLRDIVGGARSVPTLAGICFTQLTDTLQEANGLADAERRPKVDAAVLRDIFRASPSA